MALSCCAAIMWTEQILISVNSNSSTTSLTLLERAKQNDQQAWDRLVKLYAPLVYRLCRVSQVQAADARDIVQDVFQSVFANIDRFRRDRPGDSFRAWLLTITKNKIRDYFRARQRHVEAAGGSKMRDLLQQLPALDWTATNDDSSFDSSSNVIGRAVRMVQGDFQQKTWQAFWMTTVESQDVTGVADQLGISKWAVYQAKSRVLRRIREELDGLVD